jgi:hypothetical protein
MVLIAKQRKFLFTSRILHICLGLVAASISALLIANYPRAVYLLFIALVAAVFLLIISLRPAWGVLLSIFLFVVQKSPKLPVVGNILTISEPILILSLLVWLAQKARQQHRIKLYTRGMLGPLFIYVLVVALSLLDAFIRADIELGVAEFFARLYLAFFFVVVASYTTTHSRYNDVLLAWVASAILVVGLAVLFLFFRIAGAGPVSLIAHGDKLTALYRNPNALAGYITGTFLGFLPLVLSRQSSTAFPRVQTLARYSLFGLLVALVLADSQGAYLAVTAGVFTWIYLRVSKRLRPLLMICILLVLSIVVAGALNSPDPDAFLNRALASIGFEQSRIPARLALLNARFQTISEYPITGVGIGQAGKYVAFSSGTDEASASHVTPLGIFAETGVLGILAVSIILITLLRIVRENVTLNPAQDTGWVQLNEGLIMAFIGMLVFGMTHDIQTNRTMWLIMTLIVSLKPALLSTAPAVSSRSQPREEFSA